MKLTANVLFLVMSFLILSGVIDPACCALSIKTTPINTTKTEYIGLVHVHSFDSREYVVGKFLGIPYVLPPTGTRRFTKPEPYDPKPETLNATELKSVCPQSADPSDACMKAQPQSEDCLFANVYVPIPTLNASDVVNVTDESARALPTDKKLPVYVYIHGGGYILGSANCYDGALLAGLGEIVVVTFNYRLGVLGFLTTGDDVIPGNLALFDIVEALKWVNKHIAVFGGDPDSVTIGGNSAGAIFSIDFALFYPPADDLYKRIVALSGTPGMPKTVNKQGKMTTFGLANNLGCNIPSTGKSAEIKACLMNQTATALISADAPILAPYYFQIETTVDGLFIPRDPADLLSQAYEDYQSGTRAISASFGKKDLFIGSTPQDGEVAYRLWAVLLSGALKNMTQLAEIPGTRITIPVFKKLIFELMAEAFNESIDDYRTVIDATIDRYIDFENPEDLDAQSNRVIQMLTDYFFTVPILETALAHALPLNDSQANGRTYLYRLTLPKTDQILKLFWMNWFEGTAHDSDIPYWFGQVTDSEDVSLSKEMMTYLTNFVKTGNPNLSSTSQTKLSTLAEWKEFIVANQTYLDIAYARTELKRHFGAKTRHFWNDLIPGLQQQMANEFIAGVKKGLESSVCSVGVKPGQSVIIFVVVCVIYFI